MAIITHDGTHVVFKHGKHRGEDIDDVAKEDPGYMKWVFNNASEDLTDDLFHALESCLEENDIEP